MRRVMGTFWKGFDDGMMGKLGGPPVLKSIR